MKSRFLKLVRIMVAPVALVLAMAAFSPVSALAAARGGGHAGGFGGGQAGGFGGGHSFAAPSHAFSAPTRGNFSGNYNRGNVYGGGRAFYGGGGCYGGRGYYGGGGYYGLGFGFGVGVYPSYGYAAPVCNPPGFYDANGVWQYYPGPGCAVPHGY